jgi:hypothetical protein
MKYLHSWRCSNWYDIVGLSKYEGLAPIEYTKQKERKIDDGRKKVKFYEESDRANNFLKC